MLNAILQWRYQAGIDCDAVYVVCHEGVEGAEAFCDGVDYSSGAT